MSKEAFRLPLDRLPPERTDLRYGRLSEEAAQTLVENRIMVMAGVFSEGETTGIDRDLQIMLGVHAPVRAVRKLIDKAGADQSRLPGVLKRKPLQIDLARRAGLFSPGTQRAIGRVQGINTALHRRNAVEAKYGADPRVLNTALLARTPKDRWFPRHQDSIGTRGIGYAIQTSETLWHAQPSLTLPDVPDFCFRAYPGDVVAICERVGDLAAGQFFSLETGFEEYSPDGSVVHSGRSLSDNRVRRSLNLFHTENLG